MSRYFRSAGSVRNLVYEAVPDGPSLTTLTTMDIRPEILDELLASTDDPKEIFGADGLLASLTARLVERVTEAELDHHLCAEHAAGRKNTRNGRTKRRLLSARGPLDVSMPSPPAGYPLPTSGGGR